uniref:Putative trna splicing endonuclease n=1 Tax=Ixodes ricinus TaxID=34613 RepID=A0A147BCY8_IXORI
MRPASLAVQPFLALSLASWSSSSSSSFFSSSSSFFSSSSSFLTSSSPPTLASSAASPSSSPKVSFSAPSSLHSGSRSSAFSMTEDGIDIAKVVGFGEGSKGGSGAGFGPGDGSGASTVTGSGSSILLSRVRDFAASSSAVVTSLSGSRGFMSVALSSALADMFPTWEGLPSCC